MGDAIQALDEVLQLSLRMRDVLEEGDVDAAMHLEVQRVKLLQECFDGGAISSDSADDAAVLIKQIIALNEDMSEIGVKLKVVLQQEMESELASEAKASTAIRAYIDHMDEEK